MTPMDTWAVISVSQDKVNLECPFQLEAAPLEIPREEIGECSVGDILSTETGGREYLKYSVLSDLNDEGREIFAAYIKRKGFKYSCLEKYGFIAD